MPDLQETVIRHLKDWQSGWNIGSFGAIAEFHQDAGEEPVIEGPLVRATHRGALRVETLEDVRPIAWEALSKDPRRWQQGVSLCLPLAQATRPARTALTELGPDTNAIRPEDRAAILFDMGLGQTNVDFCVRTSDPQLIELLRSQAGRPLSAPDNPAMGAILRAHPHRVALSAIGRCEVYQKIGGPDTGGVSPPGPHTHVLPKLLAAGRTHSANVPIPQGWIPVLNLHPSSPVMGPLGDARPFDNTLFRAFQDLLDRWGADEYTATKRRIWAALETNADPDDDSGADSRVARVARRNALRQAARLGWQSPSLSRWRDMFDHGHAPADDDMPGH